MEVQFGKCCLVMIAQAADPRKWRGREAPEERALELWRTLSARGYLDGGRDTEELAALMVESAGSFSAHTSVRCTQCVGSQFRLLLLPEKQQVK